MCPGSLPCPAFCARICARPSRLQLLSCNRAVDPKNSVAAAQNPPLLCAYTENWIRLFRQTFLEKMGESNAQPWIQEVERQCRDELFKNGSWELDYRRLRIAAWKA